MYTFFKMINYYLCKTTNIHFLCINMQKTIDFFIYKRIIYSNELYISKKSYVIYTLNLTLKGII